MKTLATTLALSFFGSTTASPLSWDKVSGFNDLRGRALPEPISGATARTYLSQLTVEVESNSPAYRRELFPHWISISEGCNTRETVLKRDGVNVTTDNSCSPTSGSWFSPYDGVTWTVPTDIGVDHLVPLKEAWVSGARNWSTAMRRSFANDLVRPQLLTVTDKVNQAKGDQDPAKWLPSVASYRCAYVRAWVQVKQYYGLSVNAAEKAALTIHLYRCE